MGIVTSIFETLGQIAGEFGGLVVDLFEAAISLFYTAGEGGQGGQLTVLGVLLLISVASGLFIWAFGYIRRLVRVKTN